MMMTFLKGINFRNADPFLAGSSLAPHHKMARLRQSSLEIGFEFSNASQNTTFVRQVAYMEGGRVKMITDQKEKVRVHIRWMIRRDMTEVLEIENACFEFPWLEDDFIRCLRQRNCIGMVAESEPDGRLVLPNSGNSGIITPNASRASKNENRIVGFMVYELNKTRIHVLNFAVAPDVRRLNVGTQMLDKLVAKLSTSRRNRVLLEVRETNLDAQLFFRENGFRAVSVLRDYYEDTTEDAYLMQYRYHPERFTPVEENDEIARVG
jgi:ribosomal-protein-alanine N-acetyltransferase